MWLINTTSLRLKHFVDCFSARYAILSHTWGDEEVSFQDFQALQPPPPPHMWKTGYRKIAMVCERAKSYGLAYAWIDTCCIDKTNNVELTEAINSMFRWYRNSAICFAYLYDLPPLHHQGTGQTTDQLRACRWFSRGWTLQELIAPRTLHILDREWGMWGDRSDVAGEIENITGIQSAVLLGKEGLKSVSVARKMSWASARTTTRVEDMAYCLLGIFDINMPMIYGEGNKAFIRLQEEISKEINDLSLFAWTAQYDHANPLLRQQSYRGVLAMSAAEFKDCGSIQLMSPASRFNQHFHMTNKGLRIKTVLATAENRFVFNLQCFDARYQSSEVVEWLGIFLTQTPTGFVRSSPSQHYIASSTDWHLGTPRRIYIPKDLSLFESWQLMNQYHSTIGIPNLDEQPYRVVAAGPDMLWDASKGLYLVGSTCRFTGYLHLSVDSELFPPFDFVVVCGRRHAGGTEAHTGSEHQLEHWCVVESQSGPDWPVIFKLIQESTMVADVASLDYLSQGIQHSGRQLSSSGSCRYTAPRGPDQAWVHVSMESCRLAEFPGDWGSQADSEAYRINIQLLL